jgi:adenine-specific DNA-methyltransferase
MNGSLAKLAADALARVDEPEARMALGIWSETAHGELAGDDTRELFASEAAFAAAARAVLEERLGGRGSEHGPAFPHIYEPPLFAWYRPSEKLTEPVTQLVRVHDQADPTELLGWLYQFSIPEHIRKRFGHFYTSREIVSSMLDGVGFTGAACLRGRIIDPACGAGVFVIEATRRVLAAAESENLSPAETCDAVHRAIHALDLNPLGVLLTETALALLLAPHIAGLPDCVDLKPLHLYVTDSLRAGELRAEAHAEVAEDIKARAGEYESGFDYVVANPPYAKLPSRLMTPEQVRRFSATTYGHPNLYGLFLQVGVELLADGGRLAFINPKSFVSGLYFRNLRRFLKREVDIQRFDCFEKRTGLFDGVLQEVVILTAEKRSDRSELVELREFAGAPSKPPARQSRVPRDSVLLGEKIDHAFFIHPNPICHLVLAKMLADASQLRDLGIEAATGTIVWNRLKPHVRDEPSEDALPLIWGNGIRMFRFAGLGNRGGAGSYMALVAKTLGIVSFGEALLVKRMTAKEEPRRLVACRLPEELARSDRGYFAENHVNIVRPTSGGTEIDLDAVLGLLNSRLFDFIFRALNGNTQVSATELELLPVVDGHELPEIAEQARTLTASGGTDQRAQARLDELVYRLYGLDDEEVSEVSGKVADDLLAVG